MSDFALFPTSCLTDFYRTGIKIAVPRQRMVPNILRHSLRCGLKINS